MKITKVILALVAALASAIVFAGAVNPLNVVVTLNDDGSGSAEGDMVTARTSINDVELIGCGTKEFKNFTGFGFCQAADSENNYIVCTTTKPHLLDAMKATGDYSYIRFDVDKKGECTRIDFSTQSWYLPSNVTGN
jgi:hypothetical protein